MDPTSENKTTTIPGPDVLSSETGRETYAAVRAELRGGARRVVVDLGPVRVMDKLGAAYLQLAAQRAQAQGAEVAFEGARGHVAELLELVRPSFAPPVVEKKPRVGFFETIGDKVFSAYDELREAAGLALDAFYWSVLAPLRGRGLRVAAVLDELHEMGVRAIGIVALLNFLLGVIIALLSAAQLQQFGQTIYVADGVVIAFARELGCVLAAVVVSARTGAAIAAELATMKVQEEIDALQSMGLNTTKFLVVPKLWALFLALPALTVVAMIAGNAGGFFIGTTLLGESPHMWWDHMVQSAYTEDILHGIFKSFIFAIIIALVGCHNGLRVRGGARDVGLATTRSVVMDIFFIIVADMVFASIYFYM